MIDCRANCSLLFLRHCKNWKTQNKLAYFLKLITFWEPFSGVSSLDNEATGSSTVVENSSHHHKVGGSSIDKP